MLSYDFRCKAGKMRWFDPQPDKTWWFMLKMHKSL